MYKKKNNNEIIYNSNDNKNNCNTNNLCVVRYKQELLESDIIGNPDYDISLDECQKYAARKELSFQNNSSVNERNACIQIEDGPNNSKIVYLKESIINPVQPQDQSQVQSTTSSITTTSSTQDQQINHNNKFNHNIKQVQPQDQYELFTQDQQQDVNTNQTTINIQKYIVGQDVYFNNLNLKVLEEKCKTVIKGKDNDGDDEYFNSCLELKNYNSTGGGWDINPSECEKNNNNSTLDECKSGKRKYSCKKNIIGERCENDNTIIGNRTYKEDSNNKQFLEENCNVSEECEVIENEYSDNQNNNLSIELPEDINVSNSQTENSNIETFENISNDNNNQPKCSSLCGSGVIGTKDTCRTDIPNNNSCNVGNYSIEKDKSRTNLEFCNNKCKLEYDKKDYKSCSKNNIYDNISLDECKKLCNESEYCIKNGFNYNPTSWVLSDIDNLTDPINNEKKYNINTDSKDFSENLLLCKLKCMDKKYLGYGFNTKMVNNKIKKVDIYQCNSGNNKIIDYDGCKNCGTCNSNKIRVGKVDCVCDNDKQVVIEKSKQRNLIIHENIKSNLGTCKIPYEDKNSLNKNSKLRNLLKKKFKSKFQKRINRKNIFVTRNCDIIKDAGTQFRLPFKVISNKEIDIYDKLPKSVSSGILTNNPNIHNFITLEECKDYASKNNLNFNDKYQKGEYISKCIPDDPIRGPPLGCFVENINNNINVYYNLTESKFESDENNNKICKDNNSRNRNSKLRNLLKKKFESKFQKRINRKNIFVTRQSIYSPALNNNIKTENDCKAKFIEKMIHY